MKRKNVVSKKVNREGAAEPAQVPPVAAQVQPLALVPPAAPRQNIVIDGSIETVNWTISAVPSEPGVLAVVFSDTGRRALSFIRLDRAAVMRFASQLLSQASALP